MSSILIDDLVNILELTGQDWIEEETPEGVRHSEPKIGILTWVREMVADKDLGLSADHIRSQAPTFFGIYQDAMMVAL